MSVEQKDSNRTPIDCGINRRRFLQVAGAAAGLAIVGQFIPDIMNKVKASALGKPVSGAKQLNRLRRWAMAIDLRRCDGCQAIGLPPQCTQACIEGHFAPEPMEWIQLFEFDLPGGGTQFVPTPCQNCQNAPCVNVCPVGAAFTTPEGVVLINQEICIGCRLCLAACPYDRRFFVWGNPPVPTEAKSATYDVQHQIGAKRGTVMKCDFCPDMAQAGKPPYCVTGCPTNAIYYGDFEEDIATNGAEIVKLSQFLSMNSAYRQKEELGTKPRVYYIPGYGQAVGRNPYTKGRKPTVWPWKEIVEGSTTWKRSGR